MEKRKKGYHETVYDSVYEKEKRPFDFEGVKENLIYYSLCIAIMVALGSMAHGWFGVPKVFGN